MLSFRRSVLSALSKLPLTLLLVLILISRGCTSGTATDAGSNADGAPDAGLIDGGLTDSEAVDLPADSASKDASGDDCDPWSPRATPLELLIGPTGLEAKLEAHITAAKKSVQLMMYQLTRYALTDALIAAHDRGLAVQVLVDGEQKANITSRQKLQDAGVDIRDAPAEFSHAHAKVLLIDGELAVIMSANMNTYSMTGERNYGVVDRDPKDLAQLEQIFARDWKGSGALDLSCSRLIVSPHNSPQRLLALINNANSTLDLAVMYLSDKDLKQAVIDRAAAGVKVRALLADPNWIDSNVETAAQLAATDIPVKFMTALDLHAKLIVADEVPFVGSQNLSYTALNKNREVGVFVTDKPAAKAIIAQFEKDWQSGTVP